ncbi:glycosyltransferase family 4 protein [Gammaproteobacteria bacterium]|nr:glycosyltransferase family 4 protein [Gammaproteobacteria bacterium]
MKSKKKILRIAPYPTTEESGRGLHPYELSKNESFEVIYLTFFKNNTNYFTIPHNVNLHIGSFYTSPYPRNRNFIAKAIFSIYRVIKTFTFSIHGIYLLIRHNVDIVHIHSPMFFAVSFVGKILGKKIYITFHGTDFFRIENARWYKSIAKIFDLVFSISPAYINKLSQLHSCKVLQTYNGINKDTYKDLKSPREKKILSVGALKEAKGFPFLIKGFALFLKEYPDFCDYKLVIVGKGIMLEELSRTISELNLEDKVILAGQKNRQQIINLYNESEIFISTSLWEGFAKVLIEAMACGCKVISTDVGSSKLLLQDWGYLIKPSNDQQISDAFYAAITNIQYPFTKQTLVVEEYSWENIRLSYSDIILVE